MAEEDPNQAGKWGKKPLLILAALALLAGVGSAGYGFVTALAENPFDAPPVLVYVGIGLAVLALYVGAQTLNRPDTPDAIAEVGAGRVVSWPVLLRRYGRHLALSLSLMSTIYILWRLPQMGEMENYTAVFLLWLLAGSLYLAAFKPAGNPLSSLWKWIHVRRQLLLVMGILGGAAFLLRVWQVGELPFTVGGDEGSQGLEAVRVLDGLLRNPFSTGWLGVPTMSFFFNSWSIALFGQTVFGLRFPWVLVGTATVVVMFFLVQRLMGPRLAWATAVILTVYHYHIHFSRLGSNQIADPFFMALALLFFYRGLDKQSALDWALSGTITALALYFYAGARLVPVGLLALLAYLFLFHGWQRQLRQFLSNQGRGMLAAAGAFLLVAAPMIQYAVRFPDDFNARVNQVGIIQSGWLAREIEQQAVGALPVLWEQAQRALLAFNYFPDRTVWYGLREPLLAPLWGVLFLVGMGYALLRLVGRGANPRYAPLVVWWWGGMILGGVLTESPPSSQRLVTLAAPVSFFLAVALWQGSRLLTAVFQKRPSLVWAQGLLAIGVLFFAVGSLRTYFVEYTPQRIYGGPNAELATEIAPDLRGYSRSHAIYFVGPPWMYWGFATLPYLVPEARAQDALAPLDEATVAGFAGKPGEGLLFIFHPQRVPELAVVATAFPEGRREDVYSVANGRLLGALYVVPPKP